ncbi:MAG: hypothetical protein CME70_03360 [Halobacteriovorax sp.]|nr:hypothetical protein [Halobacteriovorax sp.]MBK23022.1 hypothetical protein [Halobacteriovorax sp.]|tara:strand:- start:53679 stop:53903 length:225 start_codon:yes stop_codon:yes gene_type:complete
MMKYINLYLAPPIILFSLTGVLINEFFYVLKATDINAGEKLFSLPLLGILSQVVLFYAQKALKEYLKETFNFEL